MNTKNKSKHRTTIHSKKNIKQKINNKRATALEIYRGA